MKLTKVTVNKYKSILKEQTVAIEPDITTLVGMNESGKTSFLQALAKTNYFNADDDFKFDTTQDYPRNELVDFENDEDDAVILKCTYEISQALKQKIHDDLGVKLVLSSNLTITYNYKGNNSVTEIGVIEKDFLSEKINGLVLSAETKKLLGSANSLAEVATITAIDGDIDLPTFQAYAKVIADAKPANWSNALNFYIYTKFLKPNQPKFWYFDDYYHLGGKININELNNGSVDEKLKTAKALLELARIKPADIISSTDYERFVALLEASSNKITNEIFKYWSTNKNLDIEFRIQDKGVIKYLDIRVKSQRHKISLPLDRRSKGFNWFFSFIVWFSKIQADKSSDYILLLDEPGLNLHASAQADLLRFFEDLSIKYQIIYTTHSPFMVESDKLNRVRTVLETDEGTVISDSIQEKDPNTLFPLQAALGYDIAQNLFISKNNLLVEGPADLLYLTIMSNILETNKRTALNDSITIVPVGGLDKVTTFISLLRGSKLGVVCLLDTFTDQKGKQRVSDLIQQKIIKEKHIRFFNEFANNGKATADIEDLFSKEEYLKIFNLAFEKEYPEIKITDLDSSLDTILKQINKVIGKDRFNHYRPANKLNQLGVDKSYFSPATLDNFEKMFIEINKLF
ncbi:AAA family ATPase [Mucilaginibacter sp. FT3.2]|uniref:AAA family ATPase n=1 Tax=Mucilaginibacter sp. FT3.2 TaxID=2723090 RepID=UPI00160D8B00|nr:AAA family ATPase [Mucilaginibacter sp. FT3.2]MBB6229953.1 putative ATP-dependent endonuclease of OLD family [Mucilaginibacter sp. FT3.2]